MRQRSCNDELINGDAMLNGGNGENGDAAEPLNGGLINGDAALNGGNGENGEMVKW